MVYMYVVRTYVRTYDVTYWIRVVPMMMIYWIVNYLPNLPISFFISLIKITLLKNSSTLQLHFIIVPNNCNVVINNHGSL